MRLNTFLRQAKIGLRRFSAEVGHAPNWAGRVLSGQRSMTLYDAMRISAATKGMVTLRDLRMHLAERNQKAVNYATLR